MRKLIIISAIRFLNKKRRFEILKCCQWPSESESERKGENEADREQNVM